jgi:acyl dehydratase
VCSGDRIRLHVTLLSADRQGNRTFLTFRYVMEIEGQAKPALVAEQVLLTHD